MTSEQFNEKYKEHLEEGHYGLGIDIPEFTEWLDKQFQDFIKEPGFTYSQIKAKFGEGRFYCTGLDKVQERLVEDKITELCRK